MASWGGGGGVWPVIGGRGHVDLLPLFAEAHANCIILDGEDQKRVDFMIKSFSKSKYATNKATYLSWAKYFNEGGKGSNSLFQVKTFLAYWLSYFVLPFSTEHELHNYVFQ